MKHIDVKQAQKRLLSIAVTVDAICKQHGIPLYMISGTMLGAVRHKGFIPWDDDMDFAVPYEQYHDLIRILREELPDNLRCLTYDTSETYKVPWIKVEDTDTIMMDPCLNVPQDKMPGLTIDVFPLVDCEIQDCRKTVKKIQRLLSILRIAYSKSNDKDNKWKNLVKSFLRHVTPVSVDDINDRILKLMGTIAFGDYYTIPVDPNYFNRFFPKCWFSPLKKYQFEDCELTGVAEYDSYLTEIYHNYMTLPPEEKRRVHCDNVFLK